MSTIWAQPLGTDPVLRHIERFPVPGERLCEAILDRGTPHETVGWIIRNKAGALIFATSTGSVRTVEQEVAENAVASWGQAGRGLRIKGSELKDLLRSVGYSQQSFARDWGVTDRNVRRWCADDLDVPIWVAKALNMMSAYNIAPFAKFAR